MNVFIKFLFLLIFAGGDYSIAFANYTDRTKEIDNLIINKLQTTKSSEKFKVPEYKGDVLTFERLSKIRNIFSMNHYLPFEKRETLPQQKLNVAKPKPILVPPELERRMNVKKTKLQTYPIDTFSFKGMVYQDKNIWGVVENTREPAKPLYIKKGELIGPDYGEVDDITKDGILVSQWHKDTQNRIWEKKQMVIH
ncbi:pilus assembly protein PilP [Allofrancisella guangzhouensis]|uniref:Pilus assembly protein n=1 Tax=Allofrancisella guangzhouensis TaxID=594679 RepID=A0A0A8E5U2_9GAMM|nr:pilus assembly protein [Allofrancisella guangzhouensis]MBK2026844.1 pilus assembly protein PilP [Allofrancisella guangzhouensis]MBK2043594.1 pilus assembly protein PilP [Allofrancisella guangzhouensis]MBK2046341.1 pilus assembly protein PilP [Allofrancisella guangzhouensis]